MTTLDAGQLAGAAADLASDGYHVFPCRPFDKRPAIDQWEQRATAKPGHARDAWTRRYRGANIGIACGRSGLLVVDLDTHGTMPDEWQLPGIADGRDAFAWLVEQAGADWPVTRWSVTPSGGWHLWFRAPGGAGLRNTAGLLAPMVDTRGAGGYIVVPPSEVGGARYEWIDARPPAPLPGWLARALRPAAPEPRRPAAESAGDAGARLRGLAEHVRAGQPGDRNGRLNWAAYHLAEMIAAGEANEADAGRLADAALDAGLRGGEREAWQTIRSALKAGGVL